MDQPKLQPLRIPVGWKVEWNTFVELDASQELVEKVDGWFSGGTLLLLTRKNRGVKYSLDMSWLPEWEWETGGFHICAYKGEQMDVLMCEFRSKDRLAVVREIEKMLQSFPMD